MHFVFLQANAFFATTHWLEKYILHNVDQHRSTYVDGEIRDFIDQYIKYENESRQHYTSR